VASSNAQAFSVEFGGMIFATNEGPYLGDARQMRSIERTDRATPDDADFLHFFLRLWFR
jgi:hypothetical protein